MAIKDTLLLSTKLEQKDLNKMEQQLQSRFTRITKRFGKGMAGALKGGGLLGIGMSLINKLLNPLKEVQESIDRTLASAGDMDSQAEFLGTTSGRLSKLNTFASAKGLDSDALFNMLGKFQSAVVTARANPNDPTAVKNFTGYTDMAEGFFAFIQSLQKMSKDDQLRVQQNVFGDKQVLRAHDFLQTDFTQLSKEFGNLDAKKMTESINKIKKLGDLEAVLTGRTKWDDVNNKASVMNRGIIYARNEAEKETLKRENERIAAYKDLQAVSLTAQKIAGLLEKGVGIIGKFITVVTPKINAVVESIEKISTSNLVKGILKYIGK